ncbi:RAPGEF2 [Bugula neritina]|uniref:RAPGEF2 n=1 Tax=Bugula neritina TaxID=10212 RepID=A0A7J7JUI5_BUGNE|nr:RAPGEF2 [Bugula neritina]
MDRRLVYSLQKLPAERSQQDLQFISHYLNTIEGLNHLREVALLRLSKVVYYEYHDGSALLWREGDIARCWYILLTGSVFINPSMYLPRKTYTSYYSSYCFFCTKPHPIGCQYCLRYALPVLLSECDIGSAVF